MDYMRIIIILKTIINGNEIVSYKSIKGIHCDKNMNSNIQYVAYYLHGMIIQI